MKFEALALSRTGEISLKKPGGWLDAWIVAIHALVCVLMVGNFQLAIIDDPGAFCSFCWLLLDSNGPKVTNNYMDFASIWNYCSHALAIMHDYSK